MKSTTMWGFGIAASVLIALAAFMLSMPGSTARATPVDCSTAVLATTISGSADSSWSNLKDRTGMLGKVSDAQEKIGAHKLSDAIRKLEAVQAKAAQLSTSSKIDATLATTISVETEAVIVCLEDHS